MWHSKQHYMEVQALKMRALADLAGAPQTFFFLKPWSLFQRTWAEEYAVIIRQDQGAGVETSVLIFMLKKVWPDMRNI